jgi:hypothetical protein
MSTTLNISGKVFGKNKPLFSDWELSLPSTPDNTPLTLQTLLTHIVLAELTAFNQRQEDRRLTRILSPGEIESGRLQGKIDMGGRDNLQIVNPEDAVSNALQSFQDGFYYVFIDDKQIESLEQSFTLHPHSQILFLRLTPLIGG